MADADIMKASAENFGFDSTWITDILNIYGPDVLALVLEAARNGFSVSFIVELVQKFGPQVLKFLLNVFTHYKASLRVAGVTGEVVTGDVIQGTDVSIDSSILSIILQQYLPLLLQKYWPLIWSQFGPALMEFIQNNLQNILQAFGPQIMQLLKDNMPAIINFVFQLLNNTNKQ